jgi:hypothetical protein
LNPATLEEQTFISREGRADTKPNLKDAYWERMNISINAIELHDSLYKDSFPISHASKLVINPPIQRER